MALLDDPSLPRTRPWRSASRRWPTRCRTTRGWDDVLAIAAEIWDQIVLDGTDVTTAVDAGAAAENELYETKGVGG